MSEKKKPIKKRNINKRKEYQARNKSDKFFENAFHQLAEIREWSSQGMSLAQMARHCGVKAATFGRWMNKHLELKLAVCDGRNDACVEVEGALIKRAIGYDLAKTETSITTDADGNIMQTVEKKNVKHIPADVKAIEFFLKNRDTERWNKSTSDVNISGGVLLVPTTPSDDWADEVKAQQTELAKSAEVKVREVLGDKYDDGE